MQIRISFKQSNETGSESAPAVVPAGFAVRRDWPDGTHELFGFTSKLSVVRRSLRRDVRFWRPGPIRPVSHLVVFLGRDAFVAYRRWCREPGCVGGLVVRRGLAGVR